MKRPTVTRSLSPRAVAAMLCLMWGMLSPVSGQNAQNLLAGVKHADKSAEKQAIEYQPVDGKPSRYAGDDIDGYMGSRAAVFSMRNRESDPFGINQDPTVKPMVKTSTKLPEKRRAALPPTPLTEIVKLIRVTTIMPGEKKFLVGVRSFAESDEFALVFQGKKMKMKVVEVTALSILFRNLENGETASLQTEMLPPGMMAGGDKIQPRGMVSPHDDIPLELGSGPDPDMEN